MENADRLFLPLPSEKAEKNFRGFLGQQYLTISHSAGLEAVASHHPDLLMFRGRIYLF